MKEMVWLMRAACLKASSFYFGLLTAIKCDAGTRELGTRLKVTSLYCLVLIRWQLFRLELTTPCSKATGSHRTGGKEITYAFCSLILQSLIHNLRLKYNCWEYCDNAKVVSSLSSFCTANSSYPGWHRSEGHSTLSFRRENAVSYALFWMGYEDLPIFGMWRRVTFHCSEALSWGRQLKASGEGHGAEAKTF